MSRAFRYFRLQLKRFFKQTVVVLLLSVLLISSMGLVYYGVFSERNSGEQNSLINVGIVGDEDDSYLNLAIKGLSTLDSSRFTLSIRYTDDEKTASDLIRRGELVAYIVIPKGFFDRAFYGDVQKVTCVTASGATDFGTQITNELMMTVTKLVENSQKAVYGLQDAAIDSGMVPDDAYKLGTELALEDVALLLKRDTAFELKEIGTGGTSGVKDVLLCGLVVLFLMLWGITCCTVFQARNTTLNRVLSSKGTGAAAQVLGEYGAYLVFMIAAIGAFVLMALVAVMLFSDILSSTRYHVGTMIFGSIVPILTISSMQFFLYELSDSLVPGVLLQFLCAMGMGYIGGCLYPSYMFPRGVQDAVSWLPAWNCRLWLDEMLAGSASFVTFAILFGFFVLFLLLSVVVRMLRIRRKGGAA